MTETPTKGRTPPRSLQVRRTELVTPHMRRITLAGDDMAGFPAGSDGAHIKVFLPRPGQDRPVLPNLGPKGPVWPPPDQRPITRTYTVRRFDAMAGELDIDFVLHDDAGPASGWAARAKPGDFIGIAGPGGPDRAVMDADWHLLAGDLSALPAIAATLESLPAAARGFAFIEVPDGRDEQPIETRADIAIRDYLRRERGLSRDAIYAVPYWKASLSEEGYHDERHRIMDSME